MDTSTKNSVQSGLNEQDIPQVSDLAQDIIDNLSKENKRLENAIDTQARTIFERELEIKITKSLLMELVRS